ncbi:hypothetical protein BC829DRAFT_404114, partial [Chytridium lagenaria]
FGHLGIVFGVPKANGAPGAPRSLFQDHWVNDPYADKDGVAVAFADGLKGGKENYVRKMHLAPGITIQVGGIGDLAGLGFYNLNIQPGELADLGKSKSACRKLNTLSFEDVVVARSLFERVAPSVAGTFARHHARDARRKASRMILPGTKTSGRCCLHGHSVMASDLTTAASSTSLAVEVREFFAFASLLHSSTTAIKLTLPSPLFLLKHLTSTRRTNDNDAFWMYKTLSPFTVAGKDGNDVEIDSVEKALACFLRSLLDVICDRTRRGGFFRTDNF